MSKQTRSKRSAANKVNVRETTGTEQRRLHEGRPGSAPAKGAEVCRCERLISRLQECAPSGPAWTTWRSQQHSQQLRACVIYTVWFNFKNWLHQPSICCSICSRQKSAWQTCSAPREAHMCTHTCTDTHNPGVSPVVS